VISFALITFFGCINTIRGRPGMCMTRWCYMDPLRRREDTLYPLFSPLQSQPISDL
jgi:hypothetical protein